MRLPAVTALTAAVTLSLSSCQFFKPKDNTANTYDPYGQQSSNPYGQAPAGNPYGQAAQNPYGQAPANPYGQNPYGSYEQPQTYTAPQNPYSSMPSSGGGGGSGGSVTVQKGDTLTAIARRHGTSVSALKSANGLSSDLIRIGQTLQLP